MSWIGRIVEFFRELSDRVSWIALVKYLRGQMLFRAGVVMHDSGSTVVSKLVGDSCSYFESVGED